MVCGKMVPGCWGNWLVAMVPGIYKTTILLR